MEEEPEETLFQQEGLPEVSLPGNPLLEPEAYGAFVLFLAGASHAGWGDAKAGAERKRTRRRPG
jgi:hypothetical protein